MYEISIISGANYGDESKGLVANAVSKPNSLIIMPSNSCQRAHTVRHNGIKRVFRHFGSGTIQGAATYFSERFLVNPAMFKIEYQELQSLGITPKVYARTDSIIVTPLDMFANKILEDDRGEQRHGSTGCGVWASIVRDFCGIKLHLNSLCQKDLKRLQFYYDKIASNLKGEEINRSIINGEAFITNFLDDYNFMLEHVNLIHNDEEEKELLRSYSFLIFENGQGLLLDTDYIGENIYTTPAHVGCKIPSQIISKHFINEEISINNYYVTRSYLTRHGNGDIGVRSNRECDKNIINSTMMDTTNIPNPYQGTLRYGLFNNDEVIEMIKRVNKDSMNISNNGLLANNNLVITHINEFNSIDLFKFAFKDQNINLFSSDNERTFKMV